MRRRQSRIECFLGAAAEAEEGGGPLLLPREDDELVSGVPHALEVREDLPSVLAEVELLERLRDGGGAVLDWVRGKYALTCCRSSPGS
jgi:hypothetical protein